MFTLRQFIVLASVNSLLMLAYSILRIAFDEPIGFANATFFVLLFSLLITLYDRYRQVYLMRFSSIDHFRQKQTVLGAVGTGEKES